MKAPIPAPISKIMITRIEKLKARAAPKKPEPKKPEPKKPEPRKPDPRKAAKQAFVAAEKAWKANPEDYDGAIRRFEAVSKSAAGTGYDKKADRMVTRIRKL